MAIPDYQSIMLPLLIFANDGKEHSIHEAVDALSNQFQLTSEERKELLPSGQQEVFVNRVGWARTYMKKACLLKTTKRGFFEITERGINILKTKPSKIHNDLLTQFDEFKEFRKRKKKDEGKVDIEDQEQTPEEAFESAYENLRSELSNEILSQLKSCPPSLFEKIVIELLVKMG